MPINRVTDEKLLPAEEAIRMVRANPKTQARMDRLARKVREGKTKGGPSITAEELPDFLREHG